MYLLVAFLPLLSALITGLGGRNLGCKGAGYVSCFLIGATALLSSWLFFEVLLAGAPTYVRLGRWFDVEALSVHFGLQFDSLTVAMLVVVSTISALVHLYSTGYLEDDPHLPRFMSYLSLFTFLMIVLVTSDNFLQLFIGWEGVGLCSYLLISFWYTRISANKAAIKAMLVNRVGDSGLLLAMFIILGEFGTLDFVGLIPAGHSPHYLSAIGLLLFVGCIGKSAQLGLHSWLPDAMEGPTPVSALIHAATMVTAGVFLMIRTNALFEASPLTLVVVTTIGALTAFFAATVGAVQSDLKKIVAYSTCSQLGYMVMVCGLSHYSIGLFHLLNHGFFKALLFLGAGSVVHAMKDEQDIRRYGGLLLLTPLTYVCLLIGSLSLAGFPFLTGFYSKDLVLELCFGRYYLVFAYWLAGFAALITAYYSARLLLLTFVVRPNAARSSFTWAGEPGWRLTFPLIFLSLGSLFLGFLLREAILSNVVLPIVPWGVKLTPLLLGGLGFSLAWFYLASRPTPAFQALFTFLASAWGFNYLINHVLVKGIWRFGYLVTYCILDRGLLEVVGPSGIGSLFRYYSQRLSRLQSGAIFNYILIFIVFSGVYISLRRVLVQ